MAEVIIILAVAAQVAEDVKVIADAIHSVVDLVEAFKGKQNVSIQQILGHIKLMEQQLEEFILEQELRDHLGSVYAAATYWYDRALPRISADGLTLESIEGPLQFILGDLEYNISELTKAVYYFNHRPWPSKPEHPRVLSSIMLCISVLQNLLMVERQAYFALKGTAQIPTLGPAISDGISMLEKWVAAYRMNRIKLLRVSQIWEDDGGKQMPAPPENSRSPPAGPDGPPHPTGNFVVSADYSAGDDMLGKINNATYRWIRTPTERSKYMSPEAAVFPLFDQAWKATSVGGSAIPNMTVQLSSLTSQINALAV